MMCSRNAVCLFLLASGRVAALEYANRNLQGGTAGGQACDGDALSTVTNGCMDAIICAEKAVEMGYDLGSDNFPFEGDYSDKGCFFYPEDHPIYPNQAFFGTDGTCAELRIRPSDDGARMSCDGSTPAPFDPLQCDGNICVTSEACEEAATEMGLTLGGTRFPFEGEWDVKGCTYYGPNHPTYANQAFWGNGASICGQLRADPNDGSLRLTCGGGGEAALLGSQVPEDATPEPELVEGTMGPSAGVGGMTEVETEEAGPGVGAPFQPQAGGQDEGEQDVGGPGVGGPEVGPGGEGETEGELVVDETVVSSANGAEADPTPRPRPVATPMPVTNPMPSAIPVDEMVNASQVLAPALSPLDDANEIDKEEKNDKEEIDQDEMEEEEPNSNVEVSKFASGSSVVPSSVAKYAALALALFI